MPIINSPQTIASSILGIWKIQETSGELEKYCSLNEYDKDLLKSVNTEKRKLEILAVRALVNHLLPNISITYKDRKPFANKGNISISHTQNFACILWHPERKCGIDIEHFGARIQKVANRVFSQSELEMANNDICLLTTMWSAKECIIKLSNAVDADFIENIRIETIDNNRIKCRLSNEKIENYNLEYSNLENHAIVWGFD